MPEGPEVSAFEIIIRKARNEHWRRHNTPLEAAPVIFFSSLAQGTPKKDYTSLFSNSKDYSLSSEPQEPSTMMDRWDHERAQTAKYRSSSYLLRQTTPGPVSVATRGKQTLIAAGYHCLTIHWGLEAHLLDIPRRAFDELLQSPASLRSFKLPPHSMANPSSEVKNLTIMAAFISSERVFLLIDHSRLIRFYVTSIDRMWTQNDLRAGSEWWDRLWEPFEAGPDWIRERELSEKGLLRWRSDIQRNSDLHRKTILECMSAKDGGIKNNGDKDGGTDRVFAPFGRHLCNDALHVLGIFPGMPAIEICEDDEKFEAFHQGLFEYISQFNTPDNSCENFLAFQEGVDAKYSARYMQVFRKAVVNVPVSLYNRISSLGLLDPNHHIGGDYVPNDGILIKEGDHTFVKVPVYHRGKPLDVYTVIRAKPPSHWVSGRERNARDHRFDGYKSTVGPANFHNLKANMTNPHVALADSLGKPGRKPKLKNAPGKAGRPRKVPSVAQLIQKARLQENIEVESQSARERFAKMYGLEDEGYCLEDDVPVQTSPSNLDMALSNQRITRSTTKMVAGNDGLGPGLNSNPPEKKKRRLENKENIPPAEENARRSKRAKKL
ncbi:uncharacterized protein EV420DRAFT_1582203 [Desarmillaria tabescens]|uniref:Uncharacterized protein n=1 Tax=Armillaria tabescens TaxID=1929756 RepID=A0AA39JD73_ARMTA|nr:uncharacterized protein EV420DRAFT_1582203 [Desarmillaria tabescens]KAK0440204.1 hypothetical protein EV420DRAFT_1582203 [Desarmillaria tabescens]